MRTILILIAALSFSIKCFSQQTATTTDGKKVILNDNGTWKYADAAPKTAVKPAATAATCKTKGCKTNASKNGYCATHQPKTEAQKDIESKKAVLPVQCKVVVKGKRCKKTTMFPNGKCWDHGGK